VRGNNELPGRRPKSSPIGLGHFWGYLGSLAWFRRHHGGVKRPLSGILRVVSRALEPVFGEEAAAYG
jgi:hypothetical protein